VKIGQAHAYDPLHIVAISQVLEIAQVAGDDLQRLGISIGYHLHPRTRYMPYHDMHLSSIVKDVINECSGRCAAPMDLKSPKLKLSSFAMISISSIGKLRI
jgi:hypothetical protein